MLTLLRFVLVTAALMPAVGKDGDRAFARLKSLQGNWVATDAGRATPGTFEVAAGGTVVIQKSGFLLVFNREGNAVNATLFTSENSQSRFRSEGIAGSSKTLQFAFVGSANVKPGTIFASGLEIDFEGQNLFVQRWKFKEGDKESALTLTFRRMRAPQAPEQP